jgi:hypothetical protein
MGKVETKNAGKRRSNMFFMLRLGERDDRLDDILIEVSTKSRNLASILLIVQVSVEYHVYHTILVRGLASDLDA